MNTADKPSQTGSGWGLIGLGLLLAAVGAGSVALLILGLSHLYLGRYWLAGAELAACVTAAAIFFLSYGRYLDALERRTSAEIPPLSVPRGFPVVTTESAQSLPEREVPLPQSTPEPPPAASTTQPLATSTIVAIATAAYGIAIAVGGLLATQGRDRTYNLIAGALFIAAAAIVYRLGRPRST